MYTLLTIIIFSVIFLAIYFQLVKVANFNISFKNKKVKIKNIEPSILFPILLLSSHILVIIIGDIADSVSIAIFKGTLAALATDPVIILISLISGLIYKDFSKSL